MLWKLIAKVLSKMRDQYQGILY